MTNNTSTEENSDTWTTISILERRRDELWTYREPAENWSDTLERLMDAYDAAEDDE